MKSWHPFPVGYISPMRRVAYRAPLSPQQAWRLVGINSFFFFFASRDEPQQVASSSEMKRTRGGNSWQAELTAQVEEGR